MLSGAEDHYVQDLVHVLAVEAYLLERIAELHWVHQVVTATTALISKQVQYGEAARFQVAVQLVKHHVA